MAIRNIRRQATNPLAAAGTPTSAPIYVDSDDNILKMIPAGSGTTEVQIIDALSTQTLTGKTLTSPVITGALMTSAPVNVTGSSLTVSAATHAGKTITLSAAGGVAIQLPAASGTGNIYHFVVAMASNATVLSAVIATDTFVGGYAQNDSGDTAPATNDFYPAAANSNTYSPTTVGGGGVAGDWFSVQDIASTVWLFKGQGMTATDPSNRFSHV